MPLWDWMLNVCGVKKTPATVNLSSPGECGSQKYLLICDNKQYAAEHVKSTGYEFTCHFFTYIVHKFLTAVLCYCFCCPFLQS